MIPVEDVIEEWRDELKALAQRDDLRVSKYAEALLEETESKAQWK